MFKYVLLFALIAFAAADDDVHAEVKTLTSEVRHDGFDYALETSNSISQKASGDEHGNIHGEFSWVDPHGEHVQVAYVADEHGYQPSGQWIPTPPPIPAAIVKAIEWINAHPSKDDHH
ncbi:larval cuticle protein 2-like [Teleopsis dalmanni]|uniref:larval cuticle protein 2-like n=1 Tax=Teleopsis dalmanni TaxID=139649 RepID=UPI0018CFE4B3|nr:larval cuticle protein 2-like [Teleopsis dalmanni]